MGLIGRVWGRSGAEKPGSEPPKRQRADGQASIRRAVEQPVVLCDRTARKVPDAAEVHESKRLKRVKRASNDVALLHQSLYIRSVRDLPVR